MNVEQRDRIVQQLALKYARYVDDKQFDKMGDILAPDVVMASPAFECAGIPAFMEQLKFLDNFSATLHIIGNQLGEWDGDSYSGETYCVASHIYEQEGRARKLEMGLRYKDNIEPCGDTYKYTRRYLDVVWQSDLPLKD